MRIFIVLLVALTLVTCKKKEKQADNNTEITQNIENQPNDNKNTTTTIGEEQPASPKPIKPKVVKSKTELLAESTFEKDVQELTGVGDFRRAFVACDGNKNFCTEAPSSNNILKKINATDKVIQSKYCELEGTYTGSSRAYPIGKLYEWITQDAFVATQTIENLSKISNSDWKKLTRIKPTFWQKENVVYLLNPTNSAANGFVADIQNGL